MKKTLSGLLGAVALCGGPAIVHAQTTPYNWKTVTVGGGGYITGILAHPAEVNLIYARCDVGGAFRWDAANQKWIPLMDGFSRWQAEYYKVEALGLDPNNVNLLYAAVGKNAAWDPKGNLLKSTDKGAHWSVITPGNFTFEVGSDDDQKWGGERLRVSPFDSSIVLFGSRRDGLLRSTDGGATWTQVSVGSPVNDPANGKYYGITAIEFNPWTSGCVYAAVWGDGIYVSTNNGADGSWTKIGGAPANVRRMKIGWGGIFATHSTGVARGWGSGTWTDVTPSGYGGQVFGGLDTKADQVAVALGETSSNVKTFYTGSGTGTVAWTAQTTAKTNTVPWWTTGWGYLNNPWLAGIAFEPWSNGPLWITHWFGAERTDNIATATPNFTNRVKDMEITIPMALCSPTSGAELISGHLDLDGFRHNNGLDNYPSKVFGTAPPAQTTNPLYQDTYSITYSESAPATVYRVGATRYTVNGHFVGGIARSTDGGANWTQLNSWNLDSGEIGVPWRIAAARSTAQKLVLIRANTTAQYSANGGASWNSVSGLPNGPDKRWYWQQPLAADLGSGSSTFYFYNAGTLYRSANGGAKFSAVNTGLANQQFAGLRAMPGVSGELWLSLSWSGLYQSTNGGTTFSKINNVGDAQMIAIGVPATTGGTPAIYLYGSIFRGGTEVWGIFRSTDRGANWTQIDPPGMPIGNIGATGSSDNNLFLMEASRQTFGRLFVGTDGRGIFYGQPQ